MVSKRNPLELATSKMLSFVGNRKQAKHGEPQSTSEEIYCTNAEPRKKKGGRGSTMAMVYWKRVVRSSPEEDLPSAPCAPIILCSLASIPHLPSS